MKIIEGDISKIPLGPRDYIGHQCNCKTTYALGLAKTLFDLHKHADIYGDGTERQPGQAIVRKPVINLVGQIYPGPPRHANDTKVKREEWLKKALASLSSLDLDIDTLYLPYKIGCGLARGSWSVYSTILEEWAETQAFEVVLVKFSP